MPPFKEQYRIHQYASAWGRLPNADDTLEALYEVYREVLDRHFRGRATSAEVGVAWLYLQQAESRQVDVRRGHRQN
jgi:hypothetical protein